jgi:tritrans,polycis-undecaprenyl-diphosphate synthase [geranylgeranyl-diphosphate specific]
MSMDVPQHIAIIPDGNRRFAKRLMKAPWKGHEWGSKKVEDVYRWARDAGVRILTFYTLSLENLKSRPKKEMDFLMDIARKEFRSVLDGTSFMFREGIRVNVIGHLEDLPKDMQDLSNSVMEKTRDFRDFTINFAVAYGGRQELISAARSIALQIANGELSPGDVSEMILRQNLQTNGQRDPDLIIRTGFEKRLSNFLLFQSAYSELAFVDCFWPEFSKEHFDGILKDYGKRERRFGK